MSMEMAWAIDRVAAAIQELKSGDDVKEQVISDAAINISSALESIATAIDNLASAIRESDFHE